MNIKVEYDGGFPNLCSGNLIVFIDEIRWEFPDYCLSSGGSVTFDEDWSENVTHGTWEISKWPSGFPENLKYIVVEAINLHIPYGCCGGCV